MSVTPNVSIPLPAVPFDDELQLTDRPSFAQIWGFGLLFVTLISFCAALGILAMPLLNKRLYHRMLTFFVGLGVGSLSGSAIFHLLPQAFGLVEGDGNHSYMDKAWMCIIGIYLFYFVDKFLKIVIEHRKKVPTWRAVNGDALPTIVAEDGCMCENPSKAVLLSGGDVALTLVDGKHLSATAAGLAESSESLTLEAQAHGMCSHDHDVKFKQGDSVIGTVAWMIIFGDGLHNFIDGLSIGAAFTQSVLGGVSVSVAVLCEEFPHELGDVAILISAGMSARQALTYNLLSAFTCYLGFVFGVVLGDRFHADVYIFGLAGGMFLYISLASMIPEMNHVIEKQLSRSTWRGVGTLALQSSGVLVGLLCMFLLSNYGGYIKF